jgi:glycosyltransferase involved in cell wall biosynthesis
MRTVILYNTSWYVYLMRRNLISALREAGHDVSVVAPVDEYTGRVMSLGVNFYPIEMNGVGRNPLQELRSIRDIRATLNRIKPSAVLSFTVKCNLYAGLCRRGLTFRHIANISGMGEGFDTRGDGRTAVTTKALTTLYRFALSRTEHLFFQNQDDLTYCAAQGLTRSEQARWIPGSGVDLRAFPYVGVTENARRRFLMFGRILPKKGYHHYLEAAERITRDGKSRAEFWILGAPDQQRPESVQLMREIERAHRKGIVHYHPPTDDVRPIVQKADVVVLPSTYNEGVPRSLLEALASGKPIITTQWKGCRDTVEPGRNGHLIEPRSTTALTEAMRAMLEAPSEQLHEMGRASRQIAERRFDEKLVVRAYLEALGA